MTTALSLLSPRRVLFSASRVARTIAPWALALTAALAPPRPASAQPAASATPRFEVLAIDVEGTADPATEAFVVQQSGLRVGQRVAVPYDPAFTDAVRQLYNIGLFSDVEVVAERMAGQGVFLLVRVVEVPRLGELEFVGAEGTVSRTVETAGDEDNPMLEGLVNRTRGDSSFNVTNRSRTAGMRTVSRSVRDVLQERIGLLPGRPIRPSDLERARMIIRDYYRDEGFLLADARVQQAPGEAGRVNVTFQVERGPKLEVADVRFVGNEAFGERTLRRRLKHAPEQRWWRFWSSETFERSGFDQDLQDLVKFYRDRGFYGARVVRDTFYVDPTIRGGRPGIVVEVHLDEGPRYAVRNVEFEGNTLFTDDELRAALGFERGDVLTMNRLERNLYYTPEHTDLASLYTDRGHLRFNIVETFVEAPGDSLDLHFEVEEGDVYEFGDVAIVGNTRTKDHVIRRELRTVPGQTYSRQALERSVRELVALNYFDQTTLAGGPDVAINDTSRTVDLTYSLAETSSDQLELSGGWGGSGGLILQAGVTFNNFSIQNLFNPSAYSPLPMGDGQRLSLGITTYGTRRQIYQLSFTEPWFRGRQTPVGFSLSYQAYRGSERQLEDSTFTTDGLASASARVFYRQQLRWPDDYFQTGTDLGFRLYDISGSSLATSYGLPEGVNRELTLTQTLTRNSLDNPLFPRAGSSLDFSVAVAPPIPGFIQYHKWDLSTAWYTPITNRAALSFRTRLGYIGSLTDDDVQFQRYLVGGSPLDVQGSFRGFGKDLVFLRGYPLEVVGPRRSGEPVGGRLLTKYSAELSLVAVQSQSLSLAPYLFAEAANTYDSFDAFDPGRLYRSAGLGLRVFLPILGLIDLNYGYQIDPFEPLNTGDNGQPQWRFQFSLGGQ